MNKIKEKLLENDFGAYLYDLRCKKGYTVEELAEKINMETVTIKSVKKWEHDLEFPNLEQMYKLSEIYEVPSEELMQVKTQTLQEGVKSIHKDIIRLLGYLLGISIYGTIIISYIIIAAAFVYSIWFFINSTKAMQVGWGIEN
jgi:transcriptional regulator with XRE-family HTH domain